MLVGLPRIRQARINSGINGYFPVNYSMPYRGGAGGDGDKLSALIGLYKISLVVVVT